MNFSASHAVGAWGVKLKKTMFKQYHHDLMEERIHEE